MGIDEDLPIVSFSSKKLIDMGFTFKYDLEDMFKGAIDTCRKKGLLPYSTNEFKKRLMTSSVDDRVHDQYQSEKNGEGEAKITN